MTAPPLTPDRRALTCQAIEGLGDALGDGCGRDAGGRARSVACTKIVVMPLTRRGRGARRAMGFD